MSDAIYHDVLLVCERVNPAPQTDTRPNENQSVCCDCNALVWKPINGPPHDYTLCSYCAAHGRPQRPGRSSIRS